MKIYFMIRIELIGEFLLSVQEYFVSLIFQVRDSTNIPSKID